RRHTILVSDWSSDVCSSDLLLAIWCVSRLPLRAGDASARVPATTVLKPLCGDEPRLREALLSFCTQDFPAPLQLIFGVRSPTDRSEERRVGKECRGRVSRRC